MLAKTGAPEGLAIGREVLARAQQGFDRLSTTIALVALGDSLLHLDRLDEAIDHLEQGMAIRKAGRFRSIWWHAAARCSHRPMQRS